MNTAGIICEYNPFHMGHLWHIERTREALGRDGAIVCVMSGNFVQRGDFAVFGKHARAEAAVCCGADLVVELPSPYALSSAGGFAAAGVHILDSLGVCGFISFGSESGDASALLEAAEAITSAEADALVAEWSGKGLPYAAAMQKAADAVLGARSGLFLSPNNLLGIEYLKAIAASGSELRPMTFRRTGGNHDAGAGFSASAVRRGLLAARRDGRLGGLGGGSGGSGAFPELGGAVPAGAAMVYEREIASGRGPVFMEDYELAMLSRLRAVGDFSVLSDASEGLDRRFRRFAALEGSVAAILEGVKTKRYAMSRLRRMLMCACLGFTAGDSAVPPPYIRVLAMNGVGMGLLREARKKAQVPIVTKPASVVKFSGGGSGAEVRCLELFRKEAAATDFYSLGFCGAGERVGGQEWRVSPVVAGG